MASPITGVRLMTSRQVLQPICGDHMSIPGWVCDIRVAMPIIINGADRSPTMQANREVYAQLSVHFAACNMLMTPGKTLCYLTVAQHTPLFADWRWHIAKVEQILFPFLPTFRFTHACIFPYIIYNIRKTRSSLSRIRLRCVLATSSGNCTIQTTAAPSGKGLRCSCTAFADTTGSPCDLYIRMTST